MANGDKKKKQPPQHQTHPDAEQQLDALAHPSTWRAPGEELIAGSGVRAGETAPTRRSVLEGVFGPERAFTAVEPGSPGQQALQRSPMERLFGWLGLTRRGERLEPHPAGELAAELMQPGNWGPSGAAVTSGRILRWSTATPMSREVFLTRLKQAAERVGSTPYDEPIWGLFGTDKKAILDMSGRIAYLESAPARAAGRAHSEHLMGRVLEINPEGAGTIAPDDIMQAVRRMEAGVRPDYIVVHSAKGPLFVTPRGVQLAPGTELRPSQAKAILEELGLGADWHIARGLPVPEWLK